MIKSNVNHYPISMMCRLLDVSTSGYYSWLSRKPSARAQANELLTEKITAIFKDEKGRAGSIRITHRLQAEGEQAGRHRVARLMKLAGLRAKAAANSRRQQIAITAFVLPITYYSRILALKNLMKNG